MTPPAVLAYHDRTTRTLLVYCEHERVWHRHGDAVMGGHRVSHCACQGSPSYSTGYVLAVIGEAPEKILKDARAKRPTRCPSCPSPDLKFMHPSKVPCPRCYAPEGEPCRGMGSPYHFHRARRRQLSDVEGLHVWRFGVPA